MAILTKCVGPALLFFLALALSAQTAPAPSTAPGQGANYSDNASPGQAKKAPPEYDPLLDPPPLPRASITLIGGTVTEIDEIQNRITVKPFSGKQRLHMNFDVRTRIFRDGRPSSARDLKNGERVYLDTMLNGSKVFAKTIWIRGAAGSGNGRGQIIKYDSGASTITLRDEVSAQPVSFHLDSATVIRNGEKNGTVADLKTGTLVAITFDPTQGRSGVLREVSVLAAPGSTFTFLGKVTFIDLSQRMLAIANQSDDKKYDIYFDTVPANVRQGLREGSTASINATFDGNHYVGQKVDVIAPGTAPDAPK